MVQLEKVCKHAHELDIWASHACDEIKRTHVHKGTKQATINTVPTLVIVTLVLMLVVINLPGAGSGISSVRSN